MTIYPFIWLRTKRAWRRIRNREFLLTVSVFGVLLLLMLGSALLIGTLEPTLQTVLDAGRRLAVVLVRPMLTGVFLLWLLIPFLIGARYASTGELDRLFAFPIHMARWYALNLMWGLTDPLIFLFAPAFVWLLYGMGLLEHPGTCVISLLTLLLFVLTTIACAQWIGHLLQAIVARRRASKVFHVCVWMVSVLGIAGLVIATLRARAPFALWSKIAGLGVLRLLPSSLAADALVHLHLGDTVGFLFPLSTLVVYLVLVGWFGYRLFLKTYLEGVGPIAKRTDLDRSDALERMERRLDRMFPFLRPEVRVCIAKDLVYLTRWNVFKVFYPLSLVAYSGFLLYRLRTQGNPSEALCMWIPFVIMMTLPFAWPLPLNVFGVEGAGLRHYFIAPVPRRTVFVTKNAGMLLVNGPFMCSLLLLLFVVFRDTLAGMDWLWITAFTVYALFVWMAVGNVVSVLYPKTIDIKRFWGRQVDMRAILPMLATMYLLFLFPLLFMMGFHMSPRSMLFIYIGLAALALMGYLIALGPVSNLLERRKEQVLGTLEWGSKKI